MFSIKSKVIIFFKSVSCAQTNKDTVNVYKLTDLITKSTRIQFSRGVSEWGLGKGGGGGDQNQIANSFEIHNNEYSCEVHIFSSYGLVHILGFPEKFIIYHFLGEWLENIKWLTWH